MPRHRATPTYGSTHHHALRCLAMSGAALGASLFSPLVAAAAPGPAGHLGQPTPSRSSTARLNDALCQAADADDDQDSTHSRPAGTVPGKDVCPPTTNHADSLSAIRVQGQQPKHRHGSRGHSVHNSGAHNSAVHSSGEQRRARPMTSGERQYRRGCQQGYILEDCEQFSVANLLHHGIDPFQ